MPEILKMMIIIINYDDNDDSNDDNDNDDNYNDNG
jgi:hypothetical protein